jgi:pentatricopeptide repeat protein
MHNRTFGPYLVNRGRARLAPRAQCLAQTGRLSAARSVLEWMRRAGVPPNVITYTSLVSLGHAKDAQPGSAEDAVTHVRGTGGAAVRRVGMRLR